MLESVVVDLPVDDIGLTLKIKSFQSANRSEKQCTEWFLLCSSLVSLAKWNKREFEDNRLNNIEFAALAARAYSALFDISKEGIPYCAPSLVIMTSNHAKKLKGSLPHFSLLPGHANEAVFLKGLSDLAQWKPSDVFGNVSGRGKPSVRWLIQRLAEEFCYSFAREPTTKIIGDLVRLGWPKVTDRSIRNTFTDELVSTALKTARIRRDNENKSKTIAHQVVSALPSKSKGFFVNTNSVELTATSEISDALTLKIIEKLANTLKGESSKIRILSFIKDMQYDELDYLDDGN